MQRAKKPALVLGRGLGLAVLVHGSDSLGIRLRKPVLFLAQRTVVEGAGRCVNKMCMYASRHAPGTRGTIDWSRSHEAEHRGLVGARARWASPGQRSRANHRPTTEVSMRSVRFLLLVSSLTLCFLLITIGASAQQWSGIIDPSRAVNWSTAGVSGGIPNRTTICATLGTAGQASSFVQSVTAAQINSALSSCPANQVVLLNAGTYNLSSGILINGVSNVTLRGAGADQTLLVFTGTNGCIGQSGDICIKSADVNWPGGPSNTATFTGAGPWSRGTTSITLSSVTNLHVGSPLILDQVDDLSDNGIIYNCEQSNTSSPSQNPGCNDDSGGTGGDSGAQRGSGTPTVRGQQQIVTVTGIVGTTVTFTPGLYMPNWRVFSDSRGTNTPGAWWATGPISYVGVENLSTDDTNSGGQSGILFSNCINCWVKGIRSVQTDRSHVWLWQSPRATIRDSYFYGTRNSVSQSYGVELYGSSDALVENNIFQKVAAPQMVNADCEGCVISYNFAVNDYYSASSNWDQQSSNLHSLTSNVLYEGNVGDGIYADLFHGTHNFVTIFRNRYNGQGVNNGITTTSHANSLLLLPYSRFFNVVGNVFGTAGYHTNYQALQGSSGSTQDVSIYVLGTGTVSCCQAGDPIVLSTLFRWGNYDTVNNAVRFVATEVPSALSQFPNLLPLNQTLPSSFYLSAKPAWFGTVAWPPIGPDVTGGNILNVAGHANLNPAGACYSNTMKGPADGTGAPLTFSAATCYASGSVQLPTPPTNLKATVQ